MIRFGRALLGIAACALATPGVHADGPGLHLHAIDFDLGEDLAEITLDIELAPHDRIRDILASGTTIEYILEMEIREDNFFADKILADYSWKAAVRREGLGHSVQYRDFGSDDWISSADFVSALNEMSEMRIQLDDVELLRAIKRNADAYLAFRVEVVLDNLPSSLQVDLMTSSDWAFSSGWQEVRSATRR